MGERPDTGIEETANKRRFACMSSAHHAEREEGIMMKRNRIRLISFLILVLIAVFAFLSIQTIVFGDVLSEKAKISSDECRKQAEKFSSEVFDKKILDFVNSLTI